MDKEDFDAQIDVIKNRNYVVTLNNMQLNAQLTKLPTNEKDTQVNDNKYTLCVNITREELNELFEQKMILPGGPGIGGRKSRKNNRRKHRTTRKHRTKRNRNRHTK
jgi:hypothetical protein